MSAHESAHWRCDICDPLTIAAVVTVAAGAVSATASIQQGRAQEQIAKANARLQRIAAQDAIDRGEVRKTLLRERVSVFKGRQRSVLAASGFELDTGSALDILEDTARAAEFDILTIGANAEREAFGLRSQAEIEEFRGRQLRRQSQFQAGATILGSGSRATGFLAQKE